MISIIDYGMGNLASVVKALTKLGYDSVLINTPDEIASAEKLILPGVGAFGAAMQNLEATDLINPIRDYCQSGKPFMGICLGMQLLMTESEELGNWKGLDIINGGTVRFYRDSIPPDGIKIPHMGWNALDIRQNSGLLSGLSEGSSVYFVHSFYVVPDDLSVIAANCTHGESFCAALQKGNVWAAQFHPEKSGTVGLKMLENFCKQ